MLHYTKNQDDNIWKFSASKGISNTVFQTGFWKTVKETGLQKFHCIYALPREIQRTNYNVQGHFVKKYQHYGTLNSSPRKRFKSGVGGKRELEHVLLLCSDNPLKHSNQLGVFIKFIKQHLQLLQQKVRLCRHGPNSIKWFPKIPQIIPAASIHQIFCTINNVVKTHQSSCRLQKCCFA